MLPDLSPTHIFIVVVVALIVVGPKDLPLLLRKIGKFVGHMRGMANEFRASFDEMARQSELDELRREVEAMRVASQAPIPHDLGIAAAMKSDAGSAHVAQWEASPPAPTGVLEPAPAPQAGLDRIEAAGPADEAPITPAKRRSRKPKSSPEAEA